MNIIVHMPETDEGIAHLKRQVAQCQADLIVKKINKLNTSINEKEKMLNEVIHKIEHP